MLQLHPDPRVLSILEPHITPGWITAKCGQLLISLRDFLLFWSVLHKNSSQFIWSWLLKKFASLTQVTESLHGAVQFQGSLCCIYKQPDGESLASLGQSSVLFPDGHCSPSASRSTPQCKNSTRRGWSRDSLKNSPLKLEWGHTLKGLLQGKLASGPLVSSTKELWNLKKNHFSLRRNGVGCSVLKQQHCGLKQTSSQQQHTHTKQYFTMSLWIV